MYEDKNGSAKKQPLDDHETVDREREQAPGSSEPKSSETWLDIDALLAMRNPDWLIEDTIIEGTAVLLYGPKKVGKSFTALDMALSIATGRTWQGREVKRGAVVYVAGEGAGGLGKRVRAWLREHNISPKELRGKFFVYRKRIAINKEDDIRLKLLPGIRKLCPNPALIVLDTVNRTLHGNENDPGDMSDYLLGCDILREELPGVGTLAVHHAGKDVSRGSRGHTALAYGQDTVIELEDAGDHVFLMKCEDQRDAEPFEPQLFTLKVVRLPDDATSCVVDEADQQAQAFVKAHGRDDLADHMLAVLREAGAKGMRFRQWARAAGVDPKGKFGRRVDQLVASGAVEKSGAESGA